MIQKTFERSCRRLGKRLKELREKRGLTQEEAAELAGLHAKHIGVLETGRTNPTFASLVAVAIAYQISLEALFKGSPVLR